MCQVLELVEKEVEIIIFQTNVEEVSRSTNDETQQSTQTSSPNIEYGDPIEEINTLQLNTLKTTVNVFITIDYVTKEGWL